MDRERPDDTLPPKHGQDTDTYIETLNKMANWTNVSMVVENGFADARSYCTNAVISRAFGVDN
jgi:hypothetical protein